MTMIGRDRMHYGCVRGERVRVSREEKLGVGPL
jgi:hypothetical protein